MPPLSGASHSATLMTYSGIHFQLTCNAEQDRYELVDSYILLLGIIFIICTIKYEFITEINLTLADVKLSRNKACKLFHCILKAFLSSFHINICFDLIPCNRNKSKA